MRDLERLERDKRRPRTPRPTLVDAKLVRLMGRPASWNGNGGRMLDDIPDGVLRQARAWMKRTAAADGGSATADRMRAQCAAIDVVLVDRAAHAPQMELLPEIEPGERGARTPTSMTPVAEILDDVMTRLTAADADDGLPF